MTKPSTNWPPNWREVNDYPDPHKTPPQEWAWEFLRRNTEYQEAFKTFSANLLEIADSDDDIQAILRGPRVTAYPDTIQFLTKDRVVRTLISISPAAMQAAAAIQQKFNVSALGGLPNPSQPYKEAEPSFTAERGIKVYKPACNMMLAIGGFIPPEPYHHHVFPPKSQATNISDHINVDNISLGPTDILIKVDATSNSGVIIEKIKRLLEKEKVNLKALGHQVRTQTRTDSYRDQLRIHDADLTGASNSEIAAVIFPETENIYPDKKGNDRVAKALTLANEAIQGGYVKISAL